MAQVTNYTFSASSGTFTPLSGGTTSALSSGTVDDGYFNNKPIGFDFWYNGVRNTTVSASTNGWITFGSNITNSTPTNNLATGGAPREVIAPLWDNLDLQAASNFSYQTSGSAPNRVFTLQWLNEQWGSTATGNSISFQVKLYETTGKIEFIYRPESGALTSASASIGITAVVTGSGNYLSLNSAGTNPTVSSTSETTGINAKPVSGQTFSFTPPVPTAPSDLTFSSITGTAMTLNWTDNSSDEDGFVVYKSSDGGSTYSYASQTAAGANSSIQSGLTSGTTYHWKVCAVAEGGLSTALAGNQATLALYTLGFWVGDGVNGIPDVVLTMTGIGTIATDADGLADFTLPGGGNYTITPSLPGYTFSPTSVTFNNLSADDYTTVFTGTPANACVSNATGNWSASGTWTSCGGSIPGAGDSVEIRGSNIVTVDVSNAVAGSLQVGGTTAASSGSLVFSSGSQVTVAGAVTLSGNAAGRNGTITMTSGGTLIANSLALGTGTAVWTPGTGTVQLVATNTLPASIFTSFNNLTITGGTTTLGVNTSIAVGGTLTQSGGDIAVGSLTLTVDGTHDPNTNTVSGAGGYTLASGATLLISHASGVNGNITTTTKTLNVAANFTFDGTSAQVTGTTMPATVNNLTINNAAGVTLSQGTTINGALTFTSGTVATGANTLYIGSGGTVSRTSGHVVGNFKKYVGTGATSRTFEVGDTSSYTPVSVSFASVTTAGDLTASVASGDHANIGTSTIILTESVNRNWTLTNSGIVFTNYDATFTFLTADVDVGADTSDFIVGNYSAGWTYPTVGTKTTTSTQVTGVTAFSDFQIGNSATVSVPDVTLTTSVSPTGSAPPGADLVYTISFTSVGTGPASDFVITDPIPTNTDFKVGSVTTSLGTTGLTPTIEYYNGVTWAYTPSSAAGGAPAGYDRNVTNVRWSFTGSLSQTSPDNAGSVTVTARIR